MMEDYTGRIPLLGWDQKLGRCAGALLPRNERITYAFVLDRRLLQRASNELFDLFYIDIRRSGDVPYLLLREICRMEELCEV